MTTFAELVEAELQKRHPRLSKKNRAEAVNLVANFGWCPDPNGPSGNLAAGMVETNIKLVSAQRPDLFRAVPTVAEALEARDAEHKEKFGEPMPPGEKRLLARQLTEAVDPETALLAAVPVDWQPAASSSTTTRETAPVARFDGPGDPRFEAEVTRRWGTPPHLLSARKRQELYAALTAEDPKPAADKRELQAATVKASTRPLTPAERREEHRARARLAAGGKS